MTACRTKIQNHQSSEVKNLSFGCSWGLLGLRGRKWLIISTVTCSPSRKDLVIITDHQRSALVSTEGKQPRVTRVTTKQPPGESPIPQPTLGHQEALTWLYVCGGSGHQQQVSRDRHGACREPPWVRWVNTDTKSPDFREKAWENHRKPYRESQYFIGKPLWENHWWFQTVCICNCTSGWLTNWRMFLG